MTAKARSRSKKQDGFDDMRAILTQQREVALGLYEHDLRVGQQLSDDGAEDLIDQANNAYNREFLLLLSGSEREVVRQIEDALARLERGTFGVCENCKSEVGDDRLKALAWARYCIECQDLFERGLLEPS